MADLQALISFGNIQLTDGWDFTFQDGVRPSTCLLRSPPHLSFLEPFSTLTITYGTRRRTFIDCHISDPVFTGDMSGQDWTLPILDRRWKWQGIRISGSYNIKQANEVLLRPTTPQILATILLVRLGERNIDVSALPNIARPHITWDDALAADELDHLCHDLGCTVTIDQDGSGLTKIVSIGEGADLPSGPALGGQYSLAMKPIPKNVHVACDRTVFEVPLTLEAVGLESDFSAFKLIDDLSYKPATDGWSKEYLDDFWGVTGTYVDPFDGVTHQKRDLAIAHVFRSYRISGIGTAGNWQPWGAGGQPTPAWMDASLIPVKLKDLEILQNRAGEIIIGEQNEPLPATVNGTWYDWIRGTTTTGIWPHGFSIDPKRGIVTLSKPAVQFLSSSVPHIPATLTLQTAFFAGLNGVFQKERYTEPVPGALIDAPDSTFDRHELRRRIIRKVSGGGAILFDNYTDLQTELKAYADDLVAHVPPRDATIVQYEEIRDDIELSGKVRQITYSGGAGRPGTTKVSTGTPHNPYLPTSDEMRLPQQIRDALRPVVRLGAADFVLPDPRHPLGI